MSSFDFDDFARPVSPVIVVAQMLQYPFRSPGGVGGESAMALALAFGENHPCPAHRFIAQHTSGRSAASRRKDICLLGSTGTRFGTPVLGVLASPN